MNKRRRSVSGKVTV